MLYEWYVLVAAGDGDINVINLLQWVRLECHDSFREKWQLSLNLLVVPSDQRGMWL